MLMFIIGLILFAMAIVLVVAWCALVVASDDDDANGREDFWNECDRRFK